MTLDVSLMIEGQDGLTWGRWQRLALAAETFGYAGIYRSDHFTNAQPPDKDSLELWVSLTWVASHTHRIHFGPLVSPVSFRQPTFTARMAAAVDDLSEGRLVLGVGAGWQAREHENFGFPLGDMETRFARFEEGLEVITRLLNSDEPVDYAGDFYQLDDAILLPRPQRPGGPPLLIGGNGPRRTLPLVARYAAQWNAVYLNRVAFAECNAHLDALLREHGRAPSAVRRTLMTLCVYGSDEEVAAHAAARNTTVAALRERGVIAGPAAAIVDQLGELAAAGVEGVMLQWLDQDDIAGLEAIATDVLPQLT